MGTSLENRPRYTPTTTFETFPFPEGLTPDIRAADYAADPRAQRIAEAKRLLDERREAWLNPADLIRREPEVVPGCPDRLLPRDEAAARALKARTLTALYNARPAWLDFAHRALDAAVADACGWGDDWRAGRLTDDENHSIARRYFNTDAGVCILLAAALPKDRKRAILEHWRQIDGGGPPHDALAAALRGRAVSNGLIFAEYAEIALHLATRALALDLRPSSDGESQPRLPFGGPAALFAAASRHLLFGPYAPALADCASLSRMRRSQPLARHPEESGGLFEGRPLKEGT